MVPVEAEYRLRWADGRVRWVLGQATAQRNETGDLVGYVGTVTDISAYRPRDDETCPLASAVEQIADSVMITDRRGVIEYVNCAFKPMTGFARARTSARQDPAVQLKSGRTVRCIYEEKTILPLRDERGEITLFAATGRDITEHIRAQDALRESQQMYLELLRARRRCDHRARPRRPPADGQSGRRTDLGPRRLRAVTGRHFAVLGLLAPQDCLGADEEFRLVVQGHERPPFELEIVQPDKERRLLEAHPRLIRPLGGRTPCRSRSRYYRVLVGRSLVAHLGRFLDGSSNEIYVFEAETLRCVQVNRGRCATSARARRNRAALPRSTSSPNSTVRASRCCAHRCGARGGGTGESVAFVTTHQRQDGSRYIVEVQLQLSRHKRPPVFVEILQDISERKRVEEQLRYLAYHDGLSGLPNRMPLCERLRAAMREATRANDWWPCCSSISTVSRSSTTPSGTNQAMPCSRRWPSGLQACVCPGDTVARRGGDEFTVVLASVAHVGDVTRVARKILQAFNAPLPVSDHELFTSVNIGITIYPFDDNQNERLRKNADAAMYHAKELGRNNFQCYTAELNARARSSATSCCCTSSRRWTSRAVA